MRQVLRRGLRHIVVERIPDAPIGPHHVAVKPVRSLISSGTESASIHQDSIVKEVAENPSHLQTVLKVMRQTGPAKTIAEVRAKFKEYAVLGYSGAGWLVGKHPSVTDLTLGAPVAYGGEGTGHGELIVVGRNLVARMPENLGFEQACFTTLGSIAMNAVRRAEVELGDRVVVVGLGLVGQLVAQLARRHGGRVIAIDLNQTRVDLARSLGAEAAINAQADVTQQVLALTEGRGADVAIVAAAAKSNAPLLQGVNLCRDRGRVVVVGAIDVSVPYGDLYRKEIQLRMSRAYGPGSYDEAYERRGQDYPYGYVRWTENRNMEEFLRLVAEGHVNVDPLITHRFALEQASDAYAAVLDPASGSLGVVLLYPDETPEPAPPVRRIDLEAPAIVSGSKDKLRVAVVGAGNIGKWVHLPNVKKHPGLELRAICSTAGARGRSQGERFGAAYCCSDVAEVLADKDVDFVFVLSRNEQHASQAEAALRAGKHVFVEKPMAISEDECRRLHKAVVESGRVLAVGFNRRFAPYHVEQKAMLGGRRSPAVLNIRINNTALTGAYWAASPESGGAVMSEGVHFIDLAHWLLEAEPVRVSAYSLPADLPEPSGRNNVAASFQFDDGSIVNFTYCTAGSSSSGGEKVEIFAPGIGVHVEDMKTLDIRSRSPKKKSVYLPEKGYAAMLDHIVGAILKGERPSITELDGSRATIACLRLLESADHRGRSTAVDWVEAISGDHGA